MIYTHDPVSGLVLPRAARAGVGGLVRERQGFLHIGSRPWRGVQVPAGPVAGPVTHFTVAAVGGGALPSEVSSVAFNIAITALDVNGVVATSFAGTVVLTSTGALTGTPVTSGSFVAGVLASQSVTITNTGSFTITATKTGGTETGTSASFTVASPPSTRANLPSGMTPQYETNGAGLTSVGGALTMVTGSSATVRSPDTLLVSSGNKIVKTIETGTPPGFSAAGSHFAVPAVWDSSLTPVFGNAFNEYYESMICKIPTADFEINTVQPGWKGMAYWGIADRDGVHGPTGLYCLLLNLEEIGTGLEVRFPLEMAIQSGPSAGLNFPQNLATGTGGNFAGGTGTTFTCGAQHEVEFYFKNNTTLTSSDGILRVWIDGVKVIEYTNVQFTNAAHAVAFWGRSFDQVWGGTGGASKARNDTFEITNWFGAVR